MARGRKNIRSRRPKVSRRGKNHSRFMKADISHESIRAKWDYSKTRDENYARLGLRLMQQTRKDLSDINKHGVPKAVDIVPKAMQVTPDLSHNRGQSRKPQGFVSEDEGKYLARLISKHGDNYTAMGRDIKVNYMQHTAARLKRRCVRYIAWKAKEAAMAAAEAEAEAEAEEGDSGSGSEDASGSDSSDGSDGSDDDDDDDGSEEAEGAGAGTGAGAGARRARRSQ